MAHGPHMIYDGQVPNVQSIIIPVITQETPPDPRITTTTFFNTSQINTETVQVWVSREGGVLRQIGNFVLAPQEMQILLNVPLSPSDTMWAQTTDANTVDYMVLRTINDGFGLIAVDAFGTSKGVSTLRQMLVALGFMIEDWPSDPGPGSSPAS